MRVIRTNLIESYDQLMEFGRKHLSDKFFIEGVERKNLRNIITREMIANTLIHREFTSSYTANKQQTCSIVQFFLLYSE